MSSSDLIERRKTDLDLQLKSLPNELAQWLKRTEKPDFEKHKSQLTVLSMQMKDLNDSVRSGWGGSGDFVAIQKASRDCARVQGIWNYFREKFLMRVDAQIGAPLRAADAYSWACYRPVLEQRRRAKPTEPLREPPLVAFDNELSPWAQSRRSASALDTAAANTPQAAFEQTLAAMPIAVLGIPWTTAESLPSLAVLAHETGHVVESDFAMETTIEQGLGEAMKASPLADGWSQFWRKEVFADLFGCYAAGPSFVWALVDSIPDSPDVVKVRKRPSEVGGAAQWGKYPPATLRVLMNLAALRFLADRSPAPASPAASYRAEADKIEAYWKGAYVEHAMSAFEGDVARVVAAFYEAAALPDDLDFTRLSNEYARAYKTAVTQKSDLNPGDAFDPRTLVAIASDFRRAPVAGVTPDALAARLQKHIVSSRPAGGFGETTRGAARGVTRGATRGGPATGEGPAAPPYLKTREIASVLFSDPYRDDDER